MLKALIVDDNMDTRLLTARILRKLNCEVEAYASPQLAFSALAFANPYDVIFVDVIMPEINGIEFARVVQKKHPDARVILTSSSILPPKMQREVELHELNCALFFDHTDEHYQKVLTGILDGMQAQ